MSQVDKRRRWASGSTASADCSACMAAEPELRTRRLQASLQAFLQAFLNQAIKADDARLAAVVLRHRLITPDLPMRLMSPASLQSLPTAPLALAIAEGATDVARLLISQGASLDPIHPHGLFCHRTPILVALLFGRLAGLELLLEAGASPLATTASPSPLLCEAIRLRHADNPLPFVGALLRAGAAPNARDRAADSLLLSILRGNGEGFASAFGVVAVNLRSSPWLPATLELLVRAGLRVGHDEEQLLHAMCEGTPNRDFAQGFTHSREPLSLAVTAASAVRQHRGLAKVAHHILPPSGLDLLLLR